MNKQYSSSVYLLVIVRHIDSNEHDRKINRAQMSPQTPTTAQSSAGFVSIIQPSYCLLIPSFLNPNLI